MLIGPTVSVEELEKAMENKQTANKKTEDVIIGELENLYVKLGTLDKYIFEDGQRVLNEKHFKTKTLYEEKEKELEEIQNSIRFINKKLDEIQELENMKEIEFDKAKERVTLTLTDCILLGVETD